MAIKCIRSPWGEDTERRKIWLHRINRRNFNPRKAYLCEILQVNGELVLKDPRQMLQIKRELDQEGEEQMKVEEYPHGKDSNIIQTHLNSKRQINSELQSETCVTNFKREETEIFIAPIKVENEEIILNEQSHIINHPTLSVKEEIDENHHIIESDLQLSDQETHIPWTSSDVRNRSPHNEAEYEKIWLKNEHSESNTLYKCETYGKRLNLRNCLDTHVNPVGEGQMRYQYNLHNKKFTCNICSKIFSFKGNLTKHMRVHNGYRPYFCDICSKTFLVFNSLIQHMRVHTGESPYSCNICCKIFARSSNLTTHMRVHTGDRPYSCNICSKTFTESSSLTKHMRVHTGDRPYSCDICSNNFSSNDTLIKHMRIHTGEKPYSCNFCSKTFTVKSHLTRHMRIHTGDRPYSCNICSQTFSIKSNLTVHMRVHTGDRPYSCNICSHTFNQTGSLSRHMRLHTGDRLHSCNSCSKTFTSSGTLAIHMRIHTGDR